MRFWLRIKKNDLVLSFLFIMANALIIFLLYRYIPFFRFKDPWYLAIIFLVPLMLIFRDYIPWMKKSHMVFSSVHMAKRIKKSLRAKLYPSLLYLRLLFFSILIYAMARPQSGSNERELETEGVDIILTMDVSTSMQAEDLRPNRLEAVKNVMTEFLERRESDRIGLSIFAGQSFTQCPLTLDYGVIKQIIKDINFADREWDGTAIGNGLANAVSRLQDSKAKSRVVILLTDGVNNSGEVDPLLAAELAKNYGIRVYTIGAGTNGMAPIRVQDPFFGTQIRQMPVQIDEEILQKIASMTGAKYFRAKNNAELSQIYQDIDALEKTKINVNEFRRYSETFDRFIIIALIVFLLEHILANSYLRKLP